ncbi:hypothetical protein A5630_18855 [Mycolicibacterium mucogenicum]|uniref:Uncharacterized protein n=1 Tax=Mycolicibacterium mucogenicum TaxID=56689 RepID=A0A1A3H7B4_MYCMU|nr:hypothetical protein [Mycolicibacterium mucogenicum]OBJ43554.1 hypothetical protein A5630_18855 [Mycolicibacterium mucogenicum]
MELRAFDVALGDHAAGGCDFGRDLGLALLEVFDGDCVSHVSVDQFRFLALELDQPAALFGGQLLLLTKELIEVGGDGVLQRREGFVGEADGRPNAGDFLLDDTGLQVWQVAVGAAGVPSDAEEVVVFAAFAPAPAVADFAATAGTHQAAFKEVAMLPGAVPCDAAGGQDVLHGLPRDFID